MAIQDKTDLQTLDIAYFGAPFVSVPSKAGVEFDTLDIAYFGAPFWAVAEVLVPGTAVGLLTWTATSGSASAGATGRCASFGAVGTSASLDATGNNGGN